MSRRYRNFDPATARDMPPVAAYPDRACNGVDPAVFYPEHVAYNGPALAICSVCRYRQECLDWALQTRQCFGVWGGTTPEERGEMLRQLTA
jgi:WhiB family transcriptional regulator, redox-sensing transcriptional regulator